MKNDDVQTSALQVIGAAKVFDAFGNDLSSTGALEESVWSCREVWLPAGRRFWAETSWASVLRFEYGAVLTRDPRKDGRNWYSYCENNPISQIDPNGLDSYVWAGFSGGTVAQGQVVVTIGMDSNGDIILGFDIGSGWFAGVGGSIGGMGCRDDMEPGSTHEDAHGGSVNGQIGPIGAEFPITDKKGLDIGKGRYGTGNGLGFGLN
ncbi:hypothetical protein CCB80_02085 [Armatimonadetes bacterium Uphvl-Ar1]|nr:hypothetical protein CCB80_02085 [Armatimonadetes bacterium Uphvl-Ar1]